MSSPRLQKLLSLPPSLRAVIAKRTFAATITTFPTQLRQQSTTSNASPSDYTSSVNQTEVSHFNQLASSWWDPHGSSRLLHLMNPLRHDFIRHCLTQYPDHDPQKKLRYLDIGCGGGIFAESAARMKHTASVTAIDPTPEVIAVARKHQRLDPTLLEPGRLEYMNIAIEDLSTSSSTPPSSSSSEGQAYDIVTLFEVLEHIERPTPFLAQVLPHLNPGGWLIGSTIARTNTSWFTTKFMAEEVLGIVPRGTHDWKQYIQPQELSEWARVQQELEAWEVRGVVYVPGLGWKMVEGSETWGNYFFGVRRKL